MAVSIKKPDNKILVAGPARIVEFKTTSASILPGDLVKIATSDGEIGEGGAATGTKDLAIGIVGYEQAHADWIPVNRTTAYADNIFAPVIMCGMGSIVMANVVVGLHRGSALTSQTSAGDLTTGTIGTNHIYAILMEEGPAAGLALVLLL